MASLKVTLEGFDELMQKLDTLGRRTIIERMGRALQSSQEQVVADAKAGSPVETGELEASIAPSEVRIGSRGVLGGAETDLYYARWVEYGAGGRPAYPFLRPALDNNQAAIVEAFKAALREAVSTVG